MWDWSPYLTLVKGVDRSWLKGKHTTVLLLKECSNKVIPNDILLYPWICTCSTQTREESCCGEMELTQRPTTGQCAETESLDHSSVKVVFSPIPSPQSSGSYAKEELRARGDRWLQGNIIFIHNRTHIWTQETRQCTWSLHRFQTDRVPALRGEADTASHL